MLTKTTCGVTANSYVPRLVGFLTAMFFLATPLIAAEIDWDKAERDIRRLTPPTFATLPYRVTAELRKQGCSIPQIWGESKPHNVIKGTFGDRRQTDWAVLCSRHGKSALLVFWGGPKRCPPNPLEAADRDFLQGIGGDTAGYSRRIDAVGRDKILEFYFNVQGGSCSRRFTTTYRSSSDRTSLRRQSIGCSLLLPRGLGRSER